MLLFHLEIHRNVGTSFSYAILISVFFVPTPLKIIFEISSIVHVVSCDFMIGSHRQKTSGLSDTLSLNLTYIPVYKRIARLGGTV